MKNNAPTAKVAQSVEATYWNGATEVIDRITEVIDYTEKQYIKDCETNADGEWVEMLHDAKAIKLTPQMETYYTGGGVWLTACVVDEDSYYIYDKESETLSLYSDRFDGWDGDEFPCMRMVWSDDIDNLNGEMWTLYVEMRTHMEANSW